MSSYTTRGTISRKRPKQGIQAGAKNKKSLTLMRKHYGPTCSRVNVLQRVVMRLIICAPLSLGIYQVHADIDKSDYELVFSDEFDGTTLDQSKWNSSYLWGPYLPVNGEQQIYVDSVGLHKAHAYSPFKFTGSSLKLVASKTTTTNPAPSMPDKNSSVWREYRQYRHNPEFAANRVAYQSGIITSSESFDFTHGYVEARIKAPLGRGLWSSLWLLNKYYVESAPELSIVQSLGHLPNKVFHSYHYYEANSNWQKIITPNFETSGDDFSSEFHRFGVSWEPDKIIWFVDGNEVKRIDKSDVKRIAAQSMYLAANLAVGGDLPGSPDEQTKFPAEYEIDYIRVYQRKPPDTITAQTLAQDYQMVFVDEFDTGRLDASKWTTSYPWGPYLRLNSEQQFYLDKLAWDKENSLNAFSFPAGEGILRITAKSVDQKDLPPQPAQDASAWKDMPLRQFNPQYKRSWYPKYTSGLLSSYNAFKFVHGYAEIRARLPAGQGLWPSFWLQSSHEVGTQPEIDVVEIQGQNPTRIHQSFHFYDSAGRLVSDSSHFSQPENKTDYSEDFHTFGVAWNRNGIDWYVDGVKTKSTSNASHSPKQLMHLLVNLAVGGEFVGIATDDAIPAHFDIDYIRVYQLVGASVNATQTNKLPSTSADNSQIALGAARGAEKKNASKSALNASTQDSPEILHPPNNTALDGSSITFKWTAHASQVSKWWLFIGSRRKERDVFDSGKLDASVTELSVPLPPSGQTLYASLYYKKRGRWILTEYQYVVRDKQLSKTSVAKIKPVITTAPTLTATSEPSKQTQAAQDQSGEPPQKITLPTLSSSVNSKALTVAWAKNGTHASAWWLQLHQSPGGNVLYDSGRLGREISETVVDLSNIRGKVHAKLLYLVDGKWLSIDTQLQVAE